MVQRLGRDAAEQGGLDRAQAAGAEDDDRRVDLVGFGQQRAPGVRAGPHGRGLRIEAGCPRVLDALGCNALDAGLAPANGRGGALRAVVADQGDVRG